MPTPSWCRNPECPRRPRDPLGEGALRTELDLEFAGQELPLEFLVLADIGRDHLLHLPRAQQLAEPFIVDPGIVRGDGEVLDPAPDNCVD